MIHERMDHLQVMSFYSISVFQLYQDDGMQIMKGCVQWNPVIGRKDSRLWMVSDLKLLEQQARAIPTGLRGSQKFMKPMSIQVQI